MTAERKISLPALLTPIKPKPRKGISYTVVKLGCGRYNLEIRLSDITVFRLMNYHFIELSSHMTDGWERSLSIEDRAKIVGVLQNIVNNFISERQERLRSLLEEFRKE